MANLKTAIVITHGNEAAQTIKDILYTASSKPNQEALKIARYFEGAVAGLRSCSFTVFSNPTAATGTITFSGTGAANDTILINGVTFTAKASGATGDQWNVGASATASAAALAAAINASATALVSGHVTASAASGVVTITSKFSNVSGNAVTIAEGVDSGNAMTVSGARLTGGTNGTTATYRLGV